MLAAALLVACGGRAPASNAGNGSKTADARHPPQRVERCTTGKEAAAKEPDLANRTIARICIEGGSQATKKKIDDAFALHPGSAFAADTLRSDLENAYGTGLVDDIRASAYDADGGKLLLVIEIHERPKIAALTIEGAKANSNAELAKAFPMKSGDIYEPVKMRALVVELRDGYRAAGFDKVDIEVGVEPTNDDRVNVKLLIKEQ